MVTISEMNFESAIDKQKREEAFLANIRRNTQEFLRGVEKSAPAQETKGWECDLLQQQGDSAISHYSYKSKYASKRILKQANINLDGEKNAEHLVWPAHKQPVVAVFNDIVWRVFRISRHSDAERTVPNSPALASFARLPQNWDGYGSRPPTTQALQAADQALQESSNYLIGVPDIAPVTGGGVFIEWEAQSRDLELDILPEGRIQFVKTFENGTMDDGQVESLIKLPDLFRWLAGDTGLESARSRKP